MAGWPVCLASFGLVSGTAVLLRAEKYFKEKIS